MSANFIAHIILWLLGFVFFYHIPVCNSKKTKNTTRPTVSIVVPARNEETNIPNLLISLKGQIKAGDEILVVDDHSEDNTAAVAEKKGARVIKSRHVDVKGKCQGLMFSDFVSLTPFKQLEQIFLRLRHAFAVWE